MDIIGEEFKNKGFFNKGSYIFRAKDALEVIARCRTLGKAILRIDTFVVSIKDPQPIQADTYDLSSLNSNDPRDRGNWNAAFNYLKGKLTSGCFFGIVHK